MKHYMCSDIYPKKKKIQKIFKPDTKISHAVIIKKSLFLDDIREITQ